MEGTANGTFNKEPPALTVTSDENETRGYWKLGRLHADALHDVTKTRTGREVQVVYCIFEFLRGTTQRHGHGADGRRGVCEYVVKVLHP